MCNEIYVILLSPIFASVCAYDLSVVESANLESATE